MKKNCADLIEEANKIVKALTSEKAEFFLDKNNVLFSRSLLTIMLPLPLVIYWKSACSEAFITISVFDVSL